MIPLTIPNFRAAPVLSLKQHQEHKIPLLEQQGVRNLKISKNQKKSQVVMQKF
jgi:hypothetical protein